MDHPIVAAFVVISGLFIVFAGLFGMDPNNSNNLTNLILMGLPIAISLIGAYMGSMIPAGLLCVIGLLLYGGAAYHAFTDEGVPILNMIATCLLVLWPIATLIASYVIYDDNGGSGGYVGGGGGGYPSNPLKDSLGPMTNEELMEYDRATGYSNDPSLSGFGYNAVQEMRRKRYRYGD